MSEMVVGPVTLSVVHGGISFRLRDDKAPRLHLMRQDIDKLLPVFQCLLDTGKLKAEDVEPEKPNRMALMEPGVYVDRYRDCPDCGSGEDEPTEYAELEGRIHALEYAAGTIPENGHAIKELGERMVDLAQGVLHNAEFIYTHRQRILALEEIVKTPRELDGIYTFQEVYEDFQTVIETQKGFWDSLAKKEARIRKLEGKG